MTETSRTLRAQGLTLICPGMDYWVIWYHSFSFLEPQFPYL